MKNCGNCKYFRELPEDVKKTLKAIGDAALEVIGEELDIPEMVNLGKAEGQCRKTIPYKGCNEWPMITKDVDCGEWEEQ